MRDTILATDLAHHLKILKNIEAMAKGIITDMNIKRITKNVQDDYLLVKPALVDHLH
jgi:hypothetical protein